MRVKDERGVWSSPARSTFSTGVLKAGYVHPFKERQACTYAVPAAFDSPYGRIESAWRYDGDGRWVWTFAIPANTKARVEAPGQTPRECGPGRYEITL